MNKPTIGHYASHQRDVTAQEDAALNTALRSSTIKVEHPEIARLRAELEECKKDAERYRWLRSNWDRIATSRIYEDGTYYVYSIDMLPFRTPMDLTSLDAAIDAARKGEGE